MKRSHSELGKSQYRVCFERESGKIFGRSVPYFAMRLRILIALTTFVVKYLNKQVYSRNDFTLIRLFASHIRLIERPSQLKPVNNQLKTNFSSIITAICTNVDRGST